MTDIDAVCEAVVKERNEEIEKLHLEIDELRETVDGLTSLVRVTPSDIRAIIDENDRLREWQKQVRANATAALDELRGGMQIKGSFCNYCKEAFTTLEGKTPDECAAAAREHDATCPGNPLTVELAAGRDIVEAALAWKKSDCSVDCPLHAEGPHAHNCPGRVVLMKLAGAVERYIDAARGKEKP